MATVVLSGDAIDSNKFRDAHIRVWSAATRGAARDMNFFLGT
jgi:hypothetical protein